MSKCHSCLACDNHRIASFTDWTQLQFSDMFIAAVNFSLAAQFLFMKYTAIFYAPISILPQQGECRHNWGI